MLNIIMWLLGGIAIILIIVAILGMIISIEEGIIIFSVLKERIKEKRRQNK